MFRRNQCTITIAASIAILLVPFAENLYAQTGGADGPGGYLSWGKLLAIAIVFVIWVRTSDWINRDAMKIGEKTDMKPEVWNPIVVFSFLIGFLCVISIPIFMAGLPVYLLSAWVPLVVYFFQRRSKINADPSIARQLSAKPGEVTSVPLPQDEGAQISFTAAGADANDQQANLIRARHGTGYADVKELIIMSQFKRGEQILLDFTRSAVNGRMLVDGVWHPLPPMDRETGDAMLVSLKSLAGLNAQDRRGRQSGSFKLKSELGKAAIKLNTQGVPTGERAQLVYQINNQELLSLAELGMFPDMAEKFKATLDDSGAVVVSSPPGNGLTTTWRGSLAATDRLTRDCIAMIDAEDKETNVENIIINLYDPAKEPQHETLKGLLLKQPDFVAVPKVDDANSMDILTKQATGETTVLLRESANSAAQALLKAYAQSGDRAQFLESLKIVTGQRLVRRLCSACKVEVRVQPAIIQKLGGNPKTQGTVFNQWKLPPPEQRIDEKGREIEFPPCETCGGIGYIGRIAVFEMITVDDQLRKFIAKNPKADAIEKAALKLGKKTLASQTYQLVLLGVTSLAEAQRILK